MSLDNWRFNSLIQSIGFAMTAFSQLLDEVADAKANSLSSVLLKAKLFASRLQSRKFRSWVDAELSGYQNADDLPDYRKVTVGILGDFWGAFGAKVQNVPLATDKFPAETKAILDRHRLFDNVGHLEGMLDSNSETFHHHWEPDVVMLFRVYSGIQIRGHMLQSVQSLFTKASVRGVLQSIRGRLLEFLIELRDRFPELEADNSAAAKIPGDEVTAVFENAVFNQCTIATGNSGHAVMRDNYHAGQTGAMGPKARARNMNFQQIWNQSAKDIPLDQLAKELARLRTAMRAEGTSAEHDVAIGSVASAENAANAGDGPATLEHLKNAGKWALRIAQQIGVALAIDALKQAAA